MDIGVARWETDDVDALLRCYFLAEFLTNCVVEDGYKPPHTLTSPALALTARGSRLAGQAKGNGVELREAQVAVFIATWAGDELLVDLEKTDLEAIRSTISAEIKRKKLRYPFVPGRMLYDAIADSVFHGAQTPTADESIGLLDKLPQGVFQAGPYVSGPFGLVESRQWRLIRPGRRVRGFHCAEIGCREVHNVFLSTGDTKVSKAGETLREKTSRFHSVNTEAKARIEELLDDRMPGLQWRNNSDFPNFLVDCFTVDEIRRFVCKLLNSKGAALREECRNKLDVTIEAAEGFVDQLDIAQLVQITLLATDDELHATINRMVWSGDIAIPAGEVRESVLTTSGMGYMGIRLEASNLGVRHNPQQQFVIIRLQAIVSKAFEGGASDADARLSWLLRSYDGESAWAKLHNAVSDGDPHALVQRLIVADQQACFVAFRELGLPIDSFATAGDDEIANVLAWHLGLSAVDQPGGSSAVQDGVARLRKVVQSLPLGHIDRGDDDRIREIAGNVFPNLEGFLKRSLQFLAWILLNDHYSTTYRLTYSEQASEKFLDEWLDGKGGLPEESDEHSLGEILSCFGILSKELRALTNREASLQRDRKDFPRVARAPGTPFEFPLKHKVPFLDLNQSARDEIVGAIRNVNSRLVEGKVPEVRNGLLHGKKEIPGREAVDKACSAIEAVIHELVNSGLSPVRFLRTRSISDEFGRRRITLTSDDRQSEIVIIRPTFLNLAGFPDLSEPQIIVNAARLQSTDEPLRFRTLGDSGYQAMWENYPRRAPESPRSLTSAE